MLFLTNSFKKLVITIKHTVINNILRFLVIPKKKEKI
jgi:hypothetical protein